MVTTKYNGKFEVRYEDSQGNESAFRATEEAAALFAAAPKLLAAAKQALQDFEVVSVQDELTSGQELLTAAIKEAEAN